MHIRIKNDEFEFVISGIHTIIDTDIEIDDEEYNKFFELQSKGKQFRIKNPNGTTLFEILEEYTPVFEDIDIGVTIEDRVKNLEQENADLTYLLMEKGVI